MKIAYEDWNPKPASLNRLRQANEIIEEYAQHRDKLTVRQLYYQLVARGHLENEERNYQNLIGLITKGRDAGMISWTAIEDQHRSSSSSYIEESEQSVVSGLEHAMFFDYWKHQKNYVEVWIEKDALIGTIKNTCQEYRVRHMACKGYMSASHMWRAGQRYAKQHSHGKRCHLIHLGDHDPSGIDMTRDNQDRLYKYSSSPIEVHRIALNMDQVEEYNPPPNPAKMTDSRAEEYVENYGNLSWELDALSPPQLRELVGDKIKTLIDPYHWERTEERETEANRRLAKISIHWPEVSDFLDGLPDDNDEEF